MASRKNRSKMSKRIAIKEESGDEAVHNEADIWLQHTENQMDSSFETKTEDDSDNMSSESPHSAVMSLDVLAQVATDQLKKDPKSPPKQSRVSDITKISKRSLLNMDFLHLDQIRTLSPKFLVNLFGELTSNEITRNYSYTCFLIPEKCSATFTSFGSEIKAREQMKRHLKKHIDDLVKLKTDNEGFSFIAETVVAKKKRELAEKSMRRKKSCWNVLSTNSKKATVRGPKKKNSPKRFTGLKAQKSPKRDRSPEVEKVSTSPTTKSRSKSVVMVSAVKELPITPPANDDKVVVKIENDHIYPKEENSSKADGEWDIIEERKMPFKRTGRNVERNENIIWDILSSSQPYHDHSYTTVFGKRKAGQAFEEMAMLELDETEHDDECRLSARTSGLKFAVGSCADVEESSDAKPIIVKVGDGIQNQMHIPLIQVQFTPAEDGKAFVSPEILGHSINRPYPPMPKSDLAQKGRLPVPEEQVSSSEEDTTTAIASAKKSKRKFTEGSLEWERRLALKYIRELRMKKKDDDTHLVCKICKDKTFTATATLMYHYRSHAGIKPFVCLICNTTFTRQHSLNYHMLIHNNQSRFTCVDCGRKFRHPSHFKEHLRRHTGETPFHCMDCPVRFKTRNTYKRHLKTRHGKLLTANGIRIMPGAEFLRVQRKRGKLSGDFDEFDDVCDDDNVDPEGETNLEEFDSDKDDVETDARCDIENNKDDEVTESDHDVITTNSDVLSLADTSASNKLLQLCSQLVNQEVC